ncbi:hypothetical protein K432DRAFT_471476 [Lepidopterella palustris CBS 459.81]|uniref:DUF7907 domain-containing protein n=1 Tax=Lepidopterella palustris CBS 459.81 TaxID=1314670 RepID=A0A8E2DYG2_9PEZI|nr:hypothetical protein K432DRAFT_471476 [Lepidopterella palustris CBS 459.81]
MKLPTLLVSLPLLFLAFSQQTSASSYPSFTPIKPLYHLRTYTKLHSHTNPHSDHRFNGLYLHASPTGANPDNHYALFTSNISLAAIGFLNSTNSIEGFDLNKNQPYSFSFQMQPDAGWSEVDINAGLGSLQGVEFADMGKAGKALVLSNASKMGSIWGGWIVCDWWHNAPQLFWRYSDKYKPGPYPAPRGCADVDLIQVLLS